MEKQKSVLPSCDLGGADDVIQLRKKKGKKEDISPRSNDDYCAEYDVRRGGHLRLPAAPTKTSSRTTSFPVLLRTIPVPVSGSFQLMTGYMVPELAGPLTAFQGLLRRLGHSCSPSAFLKHPRQLALMLGPRCNQFVATVRPCKGSR